jgi:hypothetical protein
MPPMRQNAERGLLDVASDHRFSLAQRPLSLMDAGTWTLKCKVCGRTFEVEAAEEEGVLSIVTKMPCPHCKAVPKDSSTWHYLTDFRLPRKVP